MSPSMNVFFHFTMFASLYIAYEVFKEALMGWCYWLFPNGRPRYVKCYSQMTVQELVEVIMMGLRMSKAMREGCAYDEAAIFGKRKGV